MNMKTCGKCKNALPFSSFNTDNSKPNGIASHCKDCNAKRNVEWRRKRRQIEDEERKLESERERKREEWNAVNVDQIFHDVVVKKSAPSDSFEPLRGVRTRYGVGAASDSKSDYQVFTSTIEKKYESSFLDDFSKLNSEPKIKVPAVSSDLFLPLDLGNVPKAVEVPIPVAQQTPSYPKTSKDDFMSGMPDEDFLLYASGILEKAGNVLTELTRRVKTASNKRIS